MKVDLTSPGFFRDGPKPGFHPSALAAAMFPDTGERLTMIGYGSGLREEGAPYLYEGPARTFLYRQAGWGGVPATGAQQAQFQHDRAACRRQKDRYV